jgi:hypothetical protein
VAIEVHPFDHLVVVILRCPRKVKNKRYRHLSLLSLRLATELKASGSQHSPASAKWPNLPGACFCHAGVRPGRIALGWRAHFDLRRYSLLCR